MKKICSLLMMLLVSIKLLSQVGISTHNPHPSSDLELASANKTLLLNRVSKTSDINNPVNGMILYDKEHECFKGYANGVWTDCFGKTPIPAITADCEQNGFTGTLYANTAVSGVSFSVTLTNNSFSTANISFATTDIILSGISGVTVSSVNPANATLNPGGSQTVTYTLDGTPGNTGTLTSSWNKQTLSCTKSTTVLLLAPASVSALNCSSVTHNPGNSRSYDNGILKVDLSPFTASDNITATITYNGGNGSPYGTISSSSTGVTGLTASTPAGTLANGNGSVTFTVTGTPSGYGLAEFTFTLGGKTCSFTKIVGTGAYTAPGVWKAFLPHNLGADTTLDPHTPVVGLQGAYIQWGKRGPNTTGDSRVDWQTASNNGTQGFAAGPTSGNTNESAISGWSQTDASDYSWRTSAGAKTANDPCPVGYRVPTKNEWVGLNSNNTVSRTGSWANDSTYGSAIRFGSALTLPAAGARHYSNGANNNPGGKGMYWSSSELSSGGAYYLSFSEATMNPSGNSIRTIGFNIRCISE